MLGQNNIEMSFSKSEDNLKDSLIATIKEYFKDSNKGINFFGKKVSFSGVHGSKHREILEKLGDMIQYTDSNEVILQAVKDTKVLNLQDGKARTGIVQVLLDYYIQTATGKARDSLCNLKLLPGNNDFKANIIKDLIGGKQVSQEKIDNFVNRQQSDSSTVVTAFHV